MRKNPPPTIAWIYYDNDADIRVEPVKDFADTGADDYIWLSLKQNVGVKCLGNQAQTTWSIPFTDAQQWIDEWNTVITPTTEYEGTCSYSYGLRTVIVPETLFNILVNKIRLILMSEALTTHKDRTP